MSRSAQTIVIEGPDALAFAQAQFSSNVLSLATGQWQFSAWLDPRGRVRVFFHLARVADDRLLLLLRGGDGAATVESLRRFVFRSKLALDASSSWALASGDALSMHAFGDVDGASAFGCGTHSLRMVVASEANESWHLAQMHIGWPWLPAPALDAHLPSALSLHRLQAVAIDKGCYPGQEIVARMHYRGGAKRHLHRVILSHPCTSGTSLCLDGREVGQLLDVAAGDSGFEALLVLHDELAAQAVDHHVVMLDGNLSMQLLESWPP